METSPMIGASCGEAKLCSATPRAPDQTIDRPRPGQWGVRAHLNGASSPSRAPRPVAADPRGSVPLPCGAGLPMPALPSDHIWSPRVFRFLCQASFPRRRPVWNRRPFYFSSDCYVSCCQLNDWWPGVTGIETSLFYCRSSYSWWWIDADDEFEHQGIFYEF